jgi:hypothetical protein
MEWNMAQNRTHRPADWPDEVSMYPGREACIVNSYMDEDGKRYIVRFRDNGAEGMFREWEVTRNKFMVPTNS